jgi:hypothetical protein
MDSTVKLEPFVILTNNYLTFFKLNDIIDFQFDIKNGFKNYEGSELLSHYHEAAYDAYMTGYIFVKILKYKEID